MATYAQTASAQARGQIRGASGINLAIGIWLIIAPFLLATTGVAMLNDVVVGIAIALLAAVRVSRPAVSTKPASWINAVLGAWLIIAPFALGYISPAAFWNDIIVGAAVLILGIWSGMQPRTVTSMTAADERPATARSAGISRTEARRRR